MKPIYLEFTNSADAWSALLHPEQGRCDVWREQVFVGSVSFSQGGGFTVSAAHLRALLPILAEQLRPYYPLLRHQGLLTSRSNRLRVLAATA